MNKSMELWELFRIIYKRKGIVIMMTILVTLLGVLYSLYLVEPEYKSSTTLMVNTTTEDAAVDLSSINLSQRLVITYIEIAKSRVVLGQVSDEIGLGYSYEKMLTMVDVTQVENTEILKIDVVDNDPMRAKQIAEHISSAFIEEINRILRVNNVKIVDPPIAQYNPTNDRNMMNIAISVVTGLVLGLFIAFFSEYNNHNINTGADIEKHLGMNLIGTITDYSKEMKRSV